MPSSKTRRQRRQRTRIYRARVRLYSSRYILKTWGYHDAVRLARNYDGKVLG